MKSKKDRDRLRRYIVCLTFLAMAVLTFFAYHFLVATHVGSDSVIYSTPLLVPVMVVAEVCTLTVCVVLLYMKNSTSEEPEEDETPLTAESQGSGECGEELYKTDEDEIAEYPELFTKAEREAESVKTLPDIKAALATQRGGESAEIEESTQEEKENIFTDWLYREKEEEKSDFSLYSDIPDELPEGYENNYDDEDEEEDADEDYTDEAWSFTAGRKAAVCALCAALLLATLFTCSFVYTAAGKDGITLSRPFSKQTYSYSDTAEEKVDMSLLGSKLIMKIKMKDGKSVSLEPESFTATKSFDSEYPDVLAFAAYADAEMKASGAKKEVVNPAAILESYQYSPAGTQTYIECIVNNK